MKGSRGRLSKAERIPSDVLRDIQEENPKKGDPPLMKPTRVRDDLIERVEACLAGQVFDGPPSLGGIRENRYKIALVVIDTILPKGESGIRGTIINLLNQPLVEPITMDALREWKEMVADQVLAVVADNKPFRCEVCYKDFKTTQGRGAHMSLTHKIRPNKEVTGL